MPKLSDPRVHPRCANAAWWPSRGCVVSDTKIVMGIGRLCMQSSSLLRAVISHAYIAFVHVFFFPWLTCILHAVVWGGASVRRSYRAISRHSGGKARVGISLHIASLFPFCLTRHSKNADVNGVCHGNCEEALYVFLILPSTSPYFLRLTLFWLDTSDVYLKHRNDACCRRPFEAGMMYPPHPVTLPSKAFLVSIRLHWKFGFYFPHSVIDVQAAKHACDKVQSGVMPHKATYGDIKKKLQVSSWKQCSGRSEKQSSWEIRLKTQAHGKNF